MIYIGIKSRLTIEVDMDLTKFFAQSPSDILSKIDECLSLLSLSRRELSFQADIKEATLLNSYAKEKIPSFQDLYRIANAIGIPFDTLITGEEDDSKGSKDYLYWKEEGAKLFSKNGYSLSPESLMVVFPDKIALANLLNALSVKTGEMDKKRFSIVLRLLSLEQPDLLFFLNMITREYMSKYYRSQFEYRIISSLCGQFIELMAMLSSYCFRKRNSVIHNFMKAVDDLIPSSAIRNKTTFQQKTGISAVSYRTYMTEKEKSLSPSVATIVKAATTLNISSIDDAVRGEVEPLQEQLITNNLMVKNTITLPAAESNTAWLSASIILKELKTVPSFAKFLSQLLFLGDIEYFIEMGEEKDLKDSFKAQPERWDYEDFAIDIKKDRDFLEELTNSYYDRLLGYLSIVLMSPYSSFSRYKSIAQPIV